MEVGKEKDFKIASAEWGQAVAKNPKALDGYHAATIAEAKATYLVIRRIWKKTGILSPGWRQLALILRNYRKDTARKLVRIMEKLGLLVRAGKKPIQVCPGRYEKNSTGEVFRAYVLVFTIPAVIKHLKKIIGFMKFTKKRIFADGIHKKSIGGERAPPEGSHLPKKERWEWSEDGRHRVEPKKERVFRFKVENLRESFARMEARREKDVVSETFQRNFDKLTGILQKREPMEKFKNWVDEYGHLKPETPEKIGEWAKKLRKLIA